MELTIFTTNGHTYEFKNVKNFTTTENGIVFEYFNASTNVWRTSTFDYREIHCYAIEDEKEI